MSEGVRKLANDSEAYVEREIVAIFSDEASLNNAVDDLMEIGVTRADLSVLARRDELAGVPTEKLEDNASTPRSAYASPDARTEGLAAVTGGPALVAGLGGAWAVGAVGAALVPAIAITAGSAAALGAVGLLFVRFFGRKHAAHIQDQIDAGGLLLWIHAPEPSGDTAILDILAKRGARHVHVHVLTKHWGTDDVPLHGFNPDPLLGR
ncbi:hypothetical protein SAMN02745157_3793 [Kaistia soli DSM 19436]|uniref:DUF1269 domain-containing protein n=1 Tax=Kaistia soli DSM 19436 TaxID=1122133 RepID=A0A1M5I8Y2_9HYPH|nr:hypothetical protein [Kaistia soli]SHG24569.1 hypothetical protein SAMN02745157_3793 [Kaistia soli DSM 19436]